VFDRLNKMRERSIDHTVPGKDVEFSADGTLNVKGEGKFSFTDWSFSQFCTKLHLPTDFMRRSPEGDGPASRKRIIDHWKEQFFNDKTFLFRMKGHEHKDEETGAVGRVRAVLTDRYSVFDNLDLLNLVQPMVAKNNLGIQLGNVTEKSFHIRLLYPDEINVGTEETPDIHQTGIHISNSEVGSRNMTGDILLYRQICTNGMIALLDKDHLFYQRHVNVLPQEVRTKLVSAFELADVRRMEMADKVMEALGVEVLRAHSEIGKFLKLHRGTDEFIEKARESFDIEPNNSRYGVVNAITRAAQTLPIDQRVAMEEVAGRYLLAA
jgi:hypothetical protein